MIPAAYHVSGGLMQGERGTGSSVTLSLNSLYHSKFTNFCISKPQFIVKGSSSGFSVILFHSKHKILCNKGVELCLASTVHHWDCPRETCLTSCSKMTACRVLQGPSGNSVFLAVFLSISGIYVDILARRYSRPRIRVLN